MSSRTLCLKAFVVVAPWFIFVALVFRPCAASALRTGATAVISPTLFSVHLTPQQADLDWLVPVGGPEDLVLEREVNGGGFSAVTPLYVGEDRHVRFTDYPAQASDELLLRLRWTDGAGMQQFTPADTVVLPPAIVDSLGATFGATHVLVHWNLHPVDSTFVVALERSENSSGFQFVKLINSGSGPAQSFDDHGVTPGRLYSYRVSWVLGTSAVVDGATAPVPTAGALALHPDRIHLLWSLTGLHLILPPRPVSGTLERASSGGTWGALAALSTGVDSLAFDDATIVPGQAYAYRFTWLDLGDTLHTPSVSGTVPVLSATLLSLSAAPSRVDVRWQVVGDDGTYPFRVVRQALGTSTWDTLGIARSIAPGVRGIVDSTATPGSQYVYHLAWSQSGTSGQSPDEQVIAVGPTIEMGRPTPNPSHAGFAIAVGLPDASPVHLQLFDIGGRVRVENTMVGPGSFTFRLPAHTLEAGVYFVHLSGRNRKLTQRVVIAP